VDFSATLQDVGSVNAGKSSVKRSIGLTINHYRIADFKQWRPCACVG